MVIGSISSSYSLSWVSPQTEPLQPQSQACLDPAQPPLTCNWCVVEPLRVFVLADGQSVCVRCWLVEHYKLPATYVQTLVADLEEYCRWELEQNVLVGLVLQALVPLAQVCYIRNVPSGIGEVKRQELEAHKFVASHGARSSSSTTAQERAGELDNITLRDELQPLVELLIKEIYHNQ